MVLKFTKKKAQSNKTETPLKNISQICIKPKLDRLTILLDPPNELERSQIVAAAKNYLSTFDGFAHTVKKNGYQYSGHLSFTGMKSKALVQLIAKTPSKPFFRLEINPAKLGSSGIAQLHAALTQLMDGGLDYLKKHGRVSRLDVAFDLPSDELGISMNDFHFLPQEGLLRRDFSVGGDLETIYLGQPKGNQWRLYRKDKEQQKKKRTIPPTIRLERVLKNPNLKLADLKGLANPFSSVKLLEILPPKPALEKSWRWVLFQDCVRVRGITGALQMLPESRRKTYRAYLNSKNAGWWNPDEIWSLWPSAISDLALLDLGS